MSLAEAQYFARRACEQADRAAHAHDADVARVHFELTALYLERASNAVGEQLRAVRVAPTIRIAA